MSPNVPFTSNQLIFIEWLATPKIKRVPATQELLAEKLGLNRKTLYRWKLQVELQEAVTQRARELLKGDLPEIYGALRREAIKGSYQHIKLALELTGEHTDKVQVVSWQDELLELLQQGNITMEDIKDELGPDIAQEFFESAGIHLAGIGATQAES